MAKIPAHGLVEYNINGVDLWPNVRVYAKKESNKRYETHVGLTAYHLNATCDVERNVWNTAATSWQVKIKWAIRLQHKMSLHVINHFDINRMLESLSFPALKHAPNHSTPHQLGFWRRRLDNYEAPKPQLLRVKAVTRKTGARNTLVRRCCVATNRRDCSSAVELCPPHSWSWSRWLARGTSWALPHARRDEKTPYQLRRESRVRHLLLPPPLPHSPRSSSSWELVSVRSPARPHPEPPAGALSSAAVLVMWLLSVQDRFCHPSCGGDGTLQTLEVGTVC